MNNITELKRKFFNSLKRGTGEAYLIAKNNPDIDFSDYIIKGALKNYAYDGQCESSRAIHIFDLISISKKKQKIREAILEGIESETEDTWSLTHLFDLVKIYAMQGDKDAKQALYNRFYERIIEGSDWVGYQEILELDGLEGLFYIAEKIGKYLKTHHEEVQDDMIIKSFKDMFPEIDPYSELNKAAKTNECIYIYLENIRNTLESRRNYLITFKNDWNINEWIECKINYFPQKYLFEKLTENEINDFASMLLNEKNTDKIERLLYIFTKIKYPYDFRDIMSFASMRPTYKNRIVWRAIQALSLLTGDDIRDFAVRKLQKTSNPADYTDLFINNYKKGDSELLLQIIEKENKDYIIEDLAHSYIEIFETNKTNECAKPLIELYKKMNCGNCRHSVIKILIENNVLPENIKEEIKYDSFEETRNL